MQVFQIYRRQYQKEGSLKGCYLSFYSTLWGTYCVSNIRRKRSSYNVLFLGLSVQGLESLYIFNLAYFISILYFSYFPISFIPLLPYYLQYNIVFLNQVLVKVPIYTLFCLNCLYIFICPFQFRLQAKLSYQYREFYGFSKGVYNSNNNYINLVL